MQKSRKSSQQAMAPLVAETARIPRQEGNAFDECQDTVSLTCVDDSWNWQRRSFVQDVFHDVDTSVGHVSCEVIFCYPQDPS
jgi:hypothetical protein